MKYHISLNVTDHISEENGPAEMPDFLYSILFFRKDVMLLEGSR